MSRNDRLRLLDMLDAIDRILQYVRGITYEQFLADRKTQDAVARNIEIIGEAAGSLSEQTRQMHTDIEWGKIIGMRNVLIHAYFGILPEIVWGVVTDDLPELQKKLKRQIC